MLYEWLNMIERMGKPGKRFSIKIPSPSLWEMTHNHREVITTGKTTKLFYLLHLLNHGHTDSREEKS